MNLKIGILIIGSLLWRADKGRPAWRDKRLDIGKAVLVNAPICYGRLSGKTDKTHTMVFSLDATDGTAMAVPCLTPVLTCSHLFDEAMALWTVESGTSNYQISDYWGSVGLLKNPDRQIPQELLDSWAHRVLNAKDYAKISHLPNEKVCLTSDGLLQIKWPGRIDGEKRAPLDFDLLLATATDPTLNEKPIAYPSADQIASAWFKHPDGPVYFNSNRANGISTADDDEIAKLLAEKEAQSKPNKNT